MRLIIENGMKASVGVEYVKSGATGSVGLLYVYYQNFGREFSTGGTTRGLKQIIQS